MSQEPEQGRAGHAGNGGEGRPGGSDAEPPQTPASPPAPENQTASARPKYTPPSYVPPVDSDRGSNATEPIPSYPTRPLPRDLPPGAPPLPGTVLPASAQHSDQRSGTGAPLGSSSQPREGAGGASPLGPGLPSQDQPSQDQPSQSKPGQGQPSQSTPGQGQPTQGQPGQPAHTAQPHGYPGYPGQGQGANQHQGPGSHPIGPQGYPGYPGASQPNQQHQYPGQQNQYPGQQNHYPNQQNQYPGQQNHPNQQNHYPGQPNEYPPQQYPGQPYPPQGYPPQPYAQGYPGYAPAQAYGQPLYYAPAAEPKGLSIASMICGIAVYAGFGFFILPQIAAVVLGHMGLAREPGGRGFAIAGLVMGYIGIALTLAVLAFFVVFATSINQYSY